MEDRIVNCPAIISPNQGLITLTCLDINPGHLYIEIPLLSTKPTFGRVLSEKLDLLMRKRDETLASKSLYLLQKDCTAAAQAEK